MFRINIIPELAGWPDVISCILDTGLSCMSLLTMYSIMYINDGANADGWGEASLCCLILVTILLFLGIIDCLCLRLDTSGSLRPTNTVLSFSLYI